MFDRLWRVRGDVYDGDVRAGGRGRRFVLAFAVGCALSSTYGFLAGTWPFGIVEAIWSVVAVMRYFDQRPAADGDSNHRLKPKAGASSAGPAEMID